MVAINYLGMFVFGFVAGLLTAHITMRKERRQIRNNLNFERSLIEECTRKEYDEIIQETLYDLGVNREVSEKAMGAIEHAKKRIRGNISAKTAGGKRVINIGGYQC